MYFKGKSNKGGQMFHAIGLIVLLFFVWVIGNIIEGILRNESQKDYPKELGSDLPDSWFGGDFKEKKK